MQIEFEESVNVFLQSSKFESYFVLQINNYLLHCLYNDYVFLNMSPCLGMKHWAKNKSHEVSCAVWQKKTQLLVCLKKLRLRYNYLKSLIV